jgi:uncharacterized protein DUF1801
VPADVGAIPFGEKRRRNAQAERRAKTGRAQDGAKEIAAGEIRFRLPGTCSTLSRATGLVQERAAMKATNKRKGGNIPAKATGAGFSDPAVDAVFNTYPKPIKARLLALRRLILETARTTPGVGALQETLKWGQPSYLTAETKSGSTIRIDQVKSAPSQYALYFHCQTDLVETFRELYPELSYGGNRSILLDTGDEVSEPALRHCVALALTYHLNKRKAGRDR